MSKWPLVPIGDLIRPVKTWDPTKSSANDLIRYIDISAVDRDTKAITGVTEVLGAVAPSRARQLITSGDVLVSTVRPNLNAVGSVPSEFDGATASTGFCVLRTCPDKLDARYLFNWVKTPTFVADMTAKASGQSYPAVSDRMVKESRIPLPPLDEQRRIAAILDKAEEVCDKARQAAGKTAQLRESVFLDMFGDPIEQLKTGRTVPLSELLCFLTSGSRGWAAFYSDVGAKFLRIQNVGRGCMLLDDTAYVNAPATAEAKRTRVEPGDVLMSITADLGRVGVVPNDIGEAYINQHLSILRPSNIDPYYLCAFLISEAGQRQIQTSNKGGVKAGLNFDDIRNICVAVPPSHTQDRFRQSLESINELEIKHRMAHRLCERAAQSLSVMIFA